ncbi:fatty-acyl-CoA synthase [Marinimicrobium koreense]|uniref:Fatty-acyl-CoA synthase n=1 Tax=Marinimicrobium koreense TaxID=306545 RepID=A0A3N1NF98_9GAMM|nr:AMP-binding protein [Marinimicrobium koreense]ROQ18584.1 fatty-acyl-CoA synthase [Marinimicrobium koreense]
MLFYLNDRPYDRATIEARWRLLTRALATVSGRRLAVCTHDSVEWLALVLYARQHNLSIAPLPADTPRATALEKARALHCDGLIWQSAEQLVPLERQTSVQDGTLIQFSSGTTGEAKPIERTWSDIDTEITHYHQALDLPPEVVPVVACSISHSYGLICGVLATLDRGVVPRIVTGWNPKYLLKMLRAESRPLLYSSPTFIRTLMMLWPPGEPLYGVMTSGSVMPEAWFDEVRAKTENLWQQYGCSEAGCVAVARQPERADIMGMPLGHCALQAGPGPDEPEEVLVVQQGQRIVTGDAGYLDDQGRLRFCGRMDDTIITAGFNVYPHEVENALMRHAGIREVVVFKQPDPLAGERVAAVYTGTAALSDADLRAFCRQHLASHQWPSRFYHRERIPRLPSGKVSRRQLAEQFTADAAQGVA